MKKLFLVLLACLCMVGCSSSGTTTEGSDQKETSTESKVLSYELDDGKFEITRVEIRTLPEDDFALNLVLKNNTDETYEKIQVWFTIFKDKDVLGYDGNVFEYEKLEPGQESNANSWIAPLHYAEIDGFDVGDKDFTHIEVNRLIVADEKKPLETPIIISKEDLTRVN